MYAQSVTLGCDEFLRRALGLEVEPIAHSSHLYPADPEVMVPHVNYNEPAQPVPSYEQAANAIR